MADQTVDDNITDGTFTKTNDVSNKDTSIKKPHVLVIGAGGIYGYAQLGKLRMLEDMKLLSNIDTYIACGIGAIQSTILSMGINVQVCKEFVTKAGDEMFPDKSLPSLLMLSAKISTKGYFLSFDPWIKYLTAFFEGLRISVPTYQELRNITGKNLVHLAVNKNKGSHIYLSAKTTPYLSILDGMLASYNFPILFPRVVIDGFEYCGGGLYNPYPISCASNYHENEVIGVAADYQLCNNTGIPILSQFEDILLSFKFRLHFSMQSCINYKTFIGVVSNIIDGEEDYINSRNNEQSRLLALSIVNRVI